MGFTGDLNLKDLFQDLGADRGADDATETKVQITATAGNDIKQIYNNLATSVEQLNNSIGILDTDIKNYKSENASIASNLRHFNQQTELLTKYQEKIIKLGQMQNIQNDNSNSFEAGEKNKVEKNLSDAQGAIPRIVDTFNAKNISKVKLEDVQKVLKQVNSDKTADNETVKIINQFHKENNKYLQELNQQRKEMSAVVTQVAFSASKEKEGKVPQLSNEEYNKVSSILDQTTNTIIQANKNIDNIYEALGKKYNTAEIPQLLGGIQQNTYKKSFSEVYKSMLDYTPEGFNLTQKPMNFQPWIDSVVSGGFSIGEREINKETGKKLHSILDTKVKETKDILKSFNDLFNRILEGTAYVPTDTQELNTMVQKLFTMYQILIDNSAFIQEFMKQTDSITIGNKKYQEKKKDYFNKNIASVEFDNIIHNTGLMLDQVVTTMGFDSPLQSKIQGKPDEYISSYLSQERENIKLLVVQSILETIGTKELGTVLESYLPQSAEVLNYIQDKQKSNIQNSNNPIYFRLLGETPFASKKEYPTSLRPYNRKPVDAAPTQYNLIPDKIDTTKYDFQQSIPSFFEALNQFVDGIRPFVNSDITDFSEEFKITLTNNLLSGEKISEQKLLQGESLSVILKRLEAVISIVERLVTQGAIDRTNPKKPETLNFEDNNIFTLMENMKQAPSSKQVAYIFRVINLFYEFFEDLYAQCETDVKQLQNIDTALASVRPKGEGISDTKENLEQLCGRLNDYIEYYQLYLDDNGIGSSKVVRESEGYNGKTSRVSKNRIHSSKSTYTNNINGIVTEDTKVLNPFYTSQDNIITVQYKEIEDNNNIENDQAETLKQNTQSLEDLKNAINNNFEDINKENTSSNAEVSPDSEEDTDETNLEEIVKNTTEISEKLQNIDISTATDSDNQPPSEKPNSDSGIPDNNIGSGQGGSNNNNNGGNNGGNTPPPTPPTPIPPTPAPTPVPNPVPPIPPSPPNNSDLNAIEDDLLRKLVEKSMRDFAEVYNKGIKEDVKFNLKTSKTYGDEDTEDKNEIVLTLKLDNGLKQTLQYDVTSSDTGEKVFNLTNNTVTNTKYGDERDKQNNKLSSILTQVYKKKVDYLGGKDINNNDYQGKKYITDDNVRADFETRISTLEQYINDLTNKDQIDTNKLNEEIRILDTTVKSLFDDMDKAYKAQGTVDNTEQNILKSQMSEVEKATKKVDGIKDKVNTILKEVDKKNAEVNKLLKDAENSKSEVEKNSADKINSLDIYGEIDSEQGIDSTYKGKIIDLQEGGYDFPKSFHSQSLQNLLEQADSLKTTLEYLNKEQIDLLNLIDMTTDDDTKQQLTQTYKDNKNLINDCKKQYIEYTEEYVRRGKQIISIEEQVGNAIAETNEQHKQETIIASSQKKITNLKGRLDRLMYNNSKAFTNADYQADADKIYALLNSYQSNADYLDKTKINAAEQQLAKLNLRIQQNNVSGKSLGKTLNELWGRWSGTAMVGMAFRKGLQFIHQMWNAVKEVDKAMTELRKVTDEVGSTYDRYLRTAGATAKELGVSLSDIVNSTADFARLGYSLTESADLSKVATVYKNVADGVDIGTATGDIVSAMKAFSISAEDAMSVADMYNEVGNNFAISSAGIGQALTRSAASLQAAGNSLSESIALVTAGNEILQDPETMGTALKVISLRIRGASADLEDMGESTDDLCDSTSKLRAEIKALSGVDIMLDEETFKSTYQILKEISAVYNDLTGVSQAALTEKLAGKTRSNALQAILTNFDTAEKAYQTAENSAGSAMRENEKYLDSIAGKMAKISASFQELSNAVLDADWVKPLLDGINNVLDGVSDLFRTEWGDYNPFNILTVGASLALGTIEATTDGLGILTVKGKTASEQLENLFSKNPFKNEKLKWSLDILGTTLLGSQNFNANKLIDKNFLVSGDKEFKDSFKDLQNIFTNYSKINNDLDFSKLTEGTEAYNVCLRQLVDTFPDLKEESAGALIEIIKSNDTLITGTGKAEDNQKALSTAIRRTNADLVGTAIEARAASVAMATLQTIGSMAIGFALGAVVSGIGKLIDDFQHQVENAENRLAETVEKWNQASKSLTEKKNTFSNGNIAEEFVELSKGVSNTGRNIALTSDEYDRYVELSKQLYDLNPQLTHTFDEQGNVLLTFKGNVEQLNKVVNDYFDTLKDENNRKILQEAKDTFKDLNKTISPNYSSWNLKLGTEYLEYKYLLQFTAEEDEVLREQKKLDLDMWAHKVGSDFVFSVSEVLGQGITTLNIYDVISEDLSKSDSKIRTHFNQLEDSLEKSFQTEYKPIIKAKVEINEDFKNFSEDTKSAIYQVLDNIDYDFALDNFMDSGTIDFEGMTEWVTKVVQAFNDNPEISQAIAKSLDIDTKYQNGEISTEEYTKAIAEIGKTFESVDDAKTRSLLIDTAGYEEQTNKIEEIFNKATDKVGNYSGDELESFLNSLSKQELEIVYSIINDPESEYESLDALKQELEVIKREKVVISVEVKTNENNFETDYKAYTEKAKEAYDKFDNAIATVSAGNAISLEDMMSLTNLDSSLLGQFTKTADGYVIATDSLTSAREKYLKTLETEVRLNKAAAEATQAKLEADLEVLKEEATFAKNYFIAVNTTNSSDGAKEDALKDFQEKIKAVKATEEEIAKNNDIITKYGILLNDIIDPTNKSATAINNLNTALSRLNSTYNTVNNAKIDVATFGHITASNLQSLADTYPELKDDIAEYLASSMDEADNAKLIQAAERAYQKTRDDLKTFFEKELFDSEETYNSWLTNNEEMLGEWLDNNKDIYKADFKNYKTFQELKKALDKQTTDDGYTIKSRDDSGKIQETTIGLNDLVDDQGNVTDLYTQLILELSPRNEEDRVFLEWINKVVSGYQELKIGVALEGEAKEAIDNIEDDHVLSTNPDIEAYKLQLAELEHRQNMGEDVLDELEAKLAEGVQIYSKHKDQFLSDYNSTLERLHNMTNEFYNRDKSIIDHQLEMGEISHREYYNQLTQLYEKYYKGKSDFQKEDWQLQEELEKERVSLISEEQSLLQKQKDEIIKYETDAYDTQIKLLQSKIDKNKKISDELSEQNNLLEAQKALLEASQRTKYVYRQGQGFVYERDEEAYYNAKTKYAETLRDIENNALQKKIDALQEASEQSVTIIENFFNNLNDILEEQINPEKANDIGVWNEFFSEDQISALEAILGKKEELKDMYDKGRTVDYNGETYRYIDDDAIARLAENYMPIFMKAYQTELDKTMKLTDTDTLAKTKGFNNTVNKTSYGNSLNQINVQKDAIQIMIQGKVDSQTITDLRNSVYQALDDLVDRMELKAAQERGKQ